MVERKNRRLDPNVRIQSLQTFNIALGYGQTDRREFLLPPELYASDTGLQIGVVHLVTEIL
jgi:hypothetical protein